MLAFKHFLANITIFSVMWHNKKGVNELKNNNTHLVVKLIDVIIVNVSQEVAECWH